MVGQEQLVTKTQFMLAGFQTSVETRLLLDILVEGHGTVMLTLAIQETVVLFATTQRLRLVSSLGISDMGVIVKTYMNGDVLDNKVCS